MGARAAWRIVHLHRLRVLNGLVELLWVVFGGSKLVCRVNVLHLLDLLHPLHLHGGELELRQVRWRGLHELLTALRVLHQDVLLLRLHHLWQHLGMLVFLEAELLLLDYLVT